MYTDCTNVLYKGILDFYPLNEVLVSIFSIENMISGSFGTFYMSVIMVRNTSK